MNSEGNGDEHNPLLIIDMGNITQVMRNADLAVGVICAALKGRDELERYMEENHAPPQLKNCESKVIVGGKTMMLIFQSFLEGYRQAQPPGGQQLPFGVDLVEVAANACQQIQLFAIQHPDEMPHIAECFRDAMDLDMNID